MDHRGLAIAVGATTHGHGGPASEVSGVQVPRAVAGTGRKFGRAVDKDVRLYATHRDVQRLRLSKHSKKMTINIPDHSMVVVVAISEQNFYFGFLSPRQTQRSLCKTGSAIMCIHLCINRGTKPT
jgi:hypothetical protein